MTNSNTNTTAPLPIRWITDPRPGAADGCYIGCLNDIAPVFELSPDDAGGWFLFYRVLENGTGSETDSRFATGEASELMRLAGQVAARIGIASLAVVPDVPVARSQPTDTCPRCGDEAEGELPQLDAPSPAVAAAEQREWIDAPDGWQAFRRADGAVVVDQIKADDHLAEVSYVVTFDQRVGWWSVDAVNAAGLSVSVSLLDPFTCASPESMVEAVANLGSPAVQFEKGCPAVAAAK